ncbi:MAG: hypothetical protein AB7O59_22645 [Pirellulales bacterium]
MRDLHGIRGGILGCTLALVALLLGAPLVAAPKDNDKKPAAAKPEGKKSTAQERTAKKPVVEAEQPRMPPHFNKVIDEKQREKIVAILTEYLPQLEAKRAELKALVDEREKKLFGVLTPDQRRQVTELRAAAQARRAAAAAADREAGQDEAAAKTE